ncbi:NTP transferase domain-containing protein [Naasia sp. SYSU D00948]|uniref:nucleotidyltransferase family protein n=1 Tax=Naasia sp. SYSU D00948 TaxID=2817379 RepID=UPI001B302E4E|nr:nucleotidyltransferase family protein [Naasia sp. SYSU D00948]
MASATLPGLILAAGGGLRFGAPKALARSEDGEPWLQHAARALADGGADPVIAVLGASAEAAAALVPDSVRTIVAERWREGIAASLAAGLEAVEALPAVAVVVTLVDLPGLPASAVRRMTGGVGDPGMLRQAVYSGRPGHPVVIGRDHWRPLREALSGDHGARQYLVAAGVEEIECGDLWSGEDVDRR